MRKDKKKVVFLFIEAIFIVLIMILNLKAFGIKTSLILCMIFLGSFSYYLFFLEKKKVFIPYIVVFFFLNAAFLFLIYQMKFKFVYNSIFVILILIYIQGGTRMILKKYKK